MIKVCFPDTRLHLNSIFLNYYFTIIINIQLFHALPSVSPRASNNSQSLKATGRITGKIAIHRSRWAISAIYTYFREIDFDGIFVPHIFLAHLAMKLIFNNSGRRFNGKHGGF